MHSFSLEMLPQHLLCQFCAKVSYQQSVPDVVRPGIYTEHTQAKDLSCFPRQLTGILSM